MNTCPNCGGKILKGDFECRKCAYVVKSVKEVYAADKVYRSRWTLLFRAWMGAINGSHLRWLGYNEEADFIKGKYGIGISKLFGGGEGNMISYLLSIIVYQCVEMTAIMFGKYPTDAQGHPVTYFKPKDEVGQIEDQSSNIANHDS